MDPLGARSCFVDVDTLPCWNDEEVGEEVPDSSLCWQEVSDEGIHTPFPYRKDINEKVILWCGDVALLNCTAVVNSSNETLTDKNPVSDSIYRFSGPELQEAMQKLKGCRTGEAKLTKGFNLAARYIIHTVGPKYKSKYRTAAESSLYSCYRNVLQLAKEQAMSSVGLCVISTQKRCYPLEDATHIALRTVRRFLETHGAALEKVVFAVREQEEDTYRRLLPLYFPRSFDEERSSLPNLPQDIGNADGEPIVPERQIRISEKPGGHEEDSEEEDGLGQDLSLIGSHAFARMEGDVDKQRRLALQGQMSGAAQQKQHQRNYNRWLSRARTEDLSDIAALKALYQSGVDSCGRTVIVVVGRNIPVLLIDMEKALLYFIHMMDHIAAKEYVLVYFHTLTGEHNHLDSDFLKNMYDIVDGKYRKNLRALYFVHPTFRSRVSTWFFTTFTVSGLKDKVHQIESLQQLFTVISPEQIEIPPFVLDYDARENGPFFQSHSSFSGL
ncbi:ganglioside-induced differentiation-associated protein 2 [Bombina bombina]|uniref:ganglioside-induced differentiation-associated protein 2 n=1 Tax=Bombina bombina TaxID=8345 RepID=UPI00235AA13D|nr:ganglioside-induced differentiation-associated protein 2 [Bombina bombina]XP_053561744.1 ganglioside-induced differentiation-associated protein 2 [Bombina bombina]